MQGSSRYLVLLFFVCCFFPAQGRADGPVRVGILDNRPLSYTGPAGDAKGIYPDLIREIAGKENWRPVFILDSLAGNLSALQTGAIDAMIPLPKGEKTTYDISASPVVTAWGQVFTRNSQTLASILDLDGKTIGLTAGDETGIRFRNFAAQFKVACKTTLFPNYNDMCQALGAGDVDAVVMNNFTGAVFAGEFNLRPSPVLFDPVDDYLAVAKNKNAYILSALDQWISLWKGDKSSVYYEILSRWQGSVTQRPLVRGIGIAGGITALVIFLFIWNRLLGHQVRRHTKELKKSAEKYKALSDKALVGIFQINDQGRLIMTNQRMAEIFSFPADDTGLGRNIRIRDLFVHPNQFSQIETELDEKGAVEGRLVELVTNTKRHIWGNLYIRMTKDDQGNRLYEGFLEDVSQRHRHAQLLQARLRLSQMSGACTTQELLQAFLDSAEHLTGSQIGFFHFLSDDQNTIHLQTWSANTMDTICKAQPAQTHYPVDKAGVWADCAKTMSPVIHNDYQALTTRKGLPQGHAPMIREMVVPVVRDRKVRAILGVGNKETPYTNADLEVARELADTAWEIVLKNQAETELQASESRYRQFIETAVEGIWTLDSQFCTTFANTTMAQKLGTGSGSLLGKPMEDFIFPEDMESHWEWVDNRRLEIPLQHEARFRKPDGSEFWAIVSATPLKTPDGNFDGIFAMLTDITDRKQAEQEIELTQQRFLTILNGIESTIYAADIKTHEILFMNDYMKKLFGQDLTGKICWKAFRNKEQPCPHCTNRFLLDQDGNATGLHLWEDKHPVTGRWNIYHDRAIKWVDGRMARLQIATDVTRMRTMEQQQRDYENKIQQAQKMEALGALAGGIAHDFNNILFPILGYAELLRDEFPEKTRKRKGLEEIMKGAERARDLVEQILTFSRQTETRVVPLKPAIIIKEVIKLMRATLPATIRIDKSIAPETKRVMADPTQVHQVVMNLMTNAFHAMESTGGVLTVHLKNTSHPDPSKPGPYVLLSVRDTGVGMDLETCKKIFDPYFTTKPDGKGTGLGLSVVHGIVKKYKGEILVNSIPGKGTCFEVYLPAVIRAEAEGPGQAKPETPGGTERILLVDDEPQVLLLEREMLQRLGYTVVTEQSSPKALDLVKTDSQGFDLVITDMTMPEMSGDILTEKIASLFPHLAVIICTGFSERLNPERIKQLGVKGILLKPVSRADLARQVRSALDGA